MLLKMATHDTRLRIWCPTMAFLLLRYIRSSSSSHVTPHRANKEESQYCLGNIEAVMPGMRVIEVVRKLPNDNACLTYLPVQ